MTGILITIVRALADFLILLVVIKVVISYFMSPYQPFRQKIDQIMDPMLNPIRKVVPLIGMMDFSPLVFILLVQVVETLLVNILYSIR